MTRSRRSSSPQPIDPVPGRRSRRSPSGALALGLLLASAACLAPASPAAAASDAIVRTPSPPGAEVYFISPQPGAELKSPITVRFGLRGMGVAPAGVEKPGTGHHHLVIDAPAPPSGAPIPSDEHYRHFGGGQTEASIDLAPGKHTLQLVLGDYEHVPHDPPVMSKRITITVVR